MAADSTAKFMAAAADSTANVFGKKETAQSREVGGLEAVVGDIDRKNSFLIY